MKSSASANRWGLRQATLIGSGLTVAITMSSPSSLEGQVLPGDVNLDGNLDVADPDALYRFLRCGDVSPACWPAGNVVNPGNESVDLGDAAAIARHLFQVKGTLSPLPEGTCAGVRPPPVGGLPSYRFEIGSPVFAVEESSGRTIADCPILLIIDTAAAMEVMHGATAWSFGIAAEGLEPLSIKHAGEYDTRSNSWVSQTIDPQKENAGGPQGAGAVSALALLCDDPTLPPFEALPNAVGRYVVASLSVALPAREGPDSRLRFVDGLIGSAEPVENIVSHYGSPVRPTLGELTLPSNDCNWNGRADNLDLAEATSTDCNANGLPDECEADCNVNGQPDECDLTSGASTDCNSNGIPDSCDVARGEPDCDGDMRPDSCAVTTDDCNRNGAWDRCDIASGRSKDVDQDGQPDECEADCNLNGTPDDAEIATDLVNDCNENGIPDTCEALGFSGPYPFSYGVGFDRDERWEQALVADLDGDGAEDFVAATQHLDTRIYLWPNAGEGRLGTIQSLFELPDTFYLLAAVASDDLDDDGDLELIVSGFGRGLDFRNVILRNDGGSVLTEVVPSAGAGGSVATGDWNGDGLQDLALLPSTTGEGRLDLLVNRGSIQFEPAGSIAGSLVGKPVSGDVDHDGDDDLVYAAGLTTFLALYLGQGMWSQEPIGDARAPVGLTDMDGDADLDILLGQGETRVETLLNDGTGAFGNGQESQLASLVGITLDHKLADLNGDGLADLVTSSARLALIACAFNQGAGTIGPLFQLVAGAYVVGLPADMDGDSRFDLVALSRRSGASDGVGDIFINRSSPAGFSVSCSRFHRGDPNDSGDTDLSDAITIFAYLFLGAAEPGCLEAVDVNNDGAPDISDGISLLGYLFLGQAAPTAPGPPPGPCGRDPDEVGGPGDLGCLRYSNCDG